jgi:uncharacterized protein YbaP (TraB family)
LARRNLLAAVLAISLVSPASAQAPAVLDDPDATVVEELVVTARLAGPAWWRVSDADTTVYVLGIPSIAPKHQQWDRLIFDRRLERANAVILPFNGLKVKLTGAPGAIISLMRLRSSKPFEAGLDAATRSRFAAARTKIGQPADRYKTNSALAAGLLLISDYRDQAGLTTTDPIKLIRYLAQRKRVKIVQRAYDLGPLIGAMAKTTYAAGRTCLDESLREAEAGPGGVQAASRAWADGQVAEALQAERSYERCLAAAPGASAFDARVKTDMMNDIIAALRTPGHSIAVVQLRPLLAQGGVLDRLEDAGYDVKTPGEE